MKETNETAAPPAAGRESLRRTVEEGYRRLAFGPVGDAVRLMLAEEKPKKRKVTIRGDEKISQYLSEDYSDDDIGSAFGGMERFKRREETVKGAVRWVSY